MLAHLVDSYGAVELDKVHRFRHHWERQASLRLRVGDPGVLTEYERQGRLHGGTQEEMEANIITAWQQTRQRGETVALMANNTKTVARLNHLAQHTRIEAGELDPAASRLGVGDEWILVGDEVVTRRNDRTLRTDQGLRVKNRDHWTITTIHPDHSVTLTGRTGTVRLPAEYVAEDLELGYVQTSHATQGRTVDTALLLVDAHTDNRGIYTPMTRGRDANHAYVVTEENQTALDVLTQAITRDWIDQPAVVRRVQLEGRQPDPPFWPSLRAHHHGAPLTSPDSGLEREPINAEDEGHDETAEERLIRLLIDKQLETIQQRRNTLHRRVERTEIGIGR